MTRTARTRAALAVGIATALVGSLVATGPVSAAVSPDAPVVISEVYGGGGNSGATLKRDYIELYNPGTTSVALSGWSVQYAAATGTSYAVTALTGEVAPGQSYLIGQAFGNGGSIDINVDVDGATAMAGASGKVALVNGTSPLTCAGDCDSVSSVVDFVGYGAADDYAGTGPTPALSNSTSASRNGNTANNAVDFNVGEPTPTFSGGPAIIEPAPDPDPVTVTIAEIQGTGDVSPYAGQPVTTTGVVTASYPTGGLNGYVIQTPGTGGALDLATHTASDAVFVYSPAAATEVSLGDTVEVTGSVSEFNGTTQITVVPGAAVRVTTAAAPVPATLVWPATDAQRESLESMLFAPQGDYTVTNTFATNQYGEVGLASGTLPLRQPTDAARPGTAEAAAVAADNAARAVILDDAATTNFLSAANRALTPPYVSLGEPVVVDGAATFTAPVIVSFRFDTWRLDPTTPLVGDGAGTDGVTFSNPRTPAPAAVGGDISVASFNVLNYFTTLGAQTPTCTPFRDRAGDGVTVSGGCDLRGAWDPADLQRQQDKTVAAINALDADVVGLIEMENSVKLGEAPDEATATLVAALNAAAGEQKWAFVPSSTELPDPAERDVITNAIIYQPAGATPVGPSRALGTESGAGQAFDIAREPVAQVFRPTAGGAPLLFVVNHFKSKGGPAEGVVVEEGDEESEDGQGFYNATRVRQAAALDAWVEQIRGGTEAVALAGDFNAYGQEDPLQVLYSSGYTDVEAAFDLDESSYSFAGQSGSLDHVLLNEAALQRATGADIWNINSGESVALEYSRYNYHGTLFYAPDPYRSSDHDPVIVGLQAGVDERPASQTRLFAIPPIHLNRLLPSVLIAFVSTDGQTPDGIVEFREGDTVVGSATVTRGVAAFVLPRTLTRGVHTYTATFVPTDPEAVRSSTSPPARVRVLG